VTLWSISVEVSRFDINENEISAIEPAAKRPTAGQWIVWETRDEAEYRRVAEAIQAALGGTTLRFP
jgi:hypothetical protein